MTTPITLDFKGDYWLGVRVTGDVELSLRYRIVCTPYAFRAAVAESAETVSWSNLTDVPEGFADGTNDLEEAGDHDHWGDSWEGDGSGLELFALNDATALEAASGGGYAIEASSGGQVVIYGSTGKSGITQKTSGILGEGSFGYGEVGLSDKESGVAGWSDEESGVYGYSSELRSVHGDSEDGVGIYGTIRANSGVLGKIGTSELSGITAVVVGEGRHTSGIGEHNYSGAGIFGNSQKGNGGHFVTQSDSSYVLRQNRPKA